MIRYSIQGRERKQRRYQAQDKKDMMWLEPSYTSSLTDIMTSLMIEKRNQKQFQDTRGSLSISQNSGKLPMKKMQKMIQKH